MLDEKNKKLKQEQVEAKKEKDVPDIKPGFDYIWGSDQDDLVEGTEE
ncbi:hypothetical protein [Paenibacillus sp. L3-i20]|nr:hypothetical protein [Paenibacillus sp. L3-i20]GKU79599.1 hypothetical protein L3i20_v239960 [Paenibacillus sp. L3-i20]